MSTFRSLTGPRAPSRTLPPAQSTSPSSPQRAPLDGKLRLAGRRNPLPPPQPQPRVTTIAASGARTNPIHSLPLSSPPKAPSCTEMPYTPPPWALSRQLAARVYGSLAALLVLAAPLGPATARIPTESMMSDGRDAERSAMMQLAAPSSAVVTPGRPSSSGAAGPNLDSSPGPGLGPSRPTGAMVGTPNYARGPGGGAGPRSTASEAAEALQLLTSARDAVDAGLHDRALELYGRLVTEHADLALAEYGRIGRAMMLYQTGRTSDSILAMEDEEVSMRGAAEVHAALAALLYSERPSLALRAEEEWNLACLFDRRYSNPDWVRANKHWPPRMIAALQKFLSLA